ncbi:hypothetical protein G7046_g5311 [Stylonectria norvegica]|nr:hypothetical protein G7046_g5311 [Stylonectria norvegica]
MGEAVGLPTAAVGHHGAIVMAMGEAVGLPAAAADEDRGPELWFNGWKSPAPLLGSVKGMSKRDQPQPRPGSMSSPRILETTVRHLAKPDDSVGFPNLRDDSTSSRRNPGRVGNGALTSRLGNVAVAFSATWVVLLLVWIPGYVDVDETQLTWVWENTAAPEGKGWSSVTSDLPAGVACGDRDAQPQFDRPGLRPRVVASGD